ncbi:GFA family protein [Roseovarius pelagicus]|uniref:GFA family protein n=1 Tax=Roseovarius pelagicus TaxID=2980108 RepID=A0ABY6D984_9RHOB|nr:GFA family protein [Roseovarius pelagicus]UXX82672.1 GFA family protein [Roseovarius pelagicus]
MSRTGSCLCGTVSYVMNARPAHTGACHCSMCRKWSGGVYLGLQTPPDGLTITGAEAVTTFTSSEWAERAFCSKCGSSLYYRVTAPGPHQGTYHVALGTLDDSDGIDLTEEIFIDEKPDGYRFAQETKTMTGAEVFAMFAPPAEE